MSLCVDLSTRIGSSRLLALGIAGLALSSATLAQHTQRVSISSSGAQGNDFSHHPSISADGRFVAFAAYPSFAPGDTNGREDVYLRDRLLGTTTWVSIGMGGVPGTGFSFNPNISPDGRYIAFDSTSDNLVPGGTSGLHVQHAFLWDSQSGMIEAVSVPTGGSQAYNGGAPVIAADGRFVTFVSRYPFVPEDTNSDRDVYLRDRQIGTTVRISLGQGGVQGDGDVHFDFPTTSSDNRFVVFASAATNMVPGDTNGKRDVFVRDLLLGTTEIMSLDAIGNLGDGHCSRAAISADGRYVAFESASTNLVPGDTNGVQDLFVRDRLLGTIERVDLDSSGQQANASCHLGYYPTISTDGRFVAFESNATNLVRDDTNLASDAFLRDRVLGTTERVSVSSAGTESNGFSYSPSVSSDGRLVGFMSGSNNLVAGDTNQEHDVFVRDRDATAFVGFCDPGAGGVIPCPCSNPPAGAGRGCDNFGAGPIDSGTLAATGAAYLGEDSVVLQASGENNTSLTVFFAGTTTVAGGAVLGAGVRCVGGSLKRLYTGSAAGGSLSRPGPGDPSVSARSAALGSTISAGDTRYYFCTYRDPAAAGPCGNSSSTINATNAGSITWSF